MPISYSQPEPFSPSIASAYGAAQQFSQDAPTIAGLAEHTASLQQQGLGRADQLRFAYAQANAQAREQDANRYATSQVHQADREQQGMNLGAQLEAQATGQMLHANTQMLAQQQGAQLQAWLGQQDLSQKEAMRLNQIHNTVGDIDAAEAAGRMAPDAAQEARFKAMGIASPLETRLKAQQERSLKATTDLHEMQTKLESQKVAEMAKVNAMTAEQRVFQRLTPEAQAEIDNQNLSPMERDAAVKAAKAAGKYDTFTIGPTGELKHIPKAADHAAETEMKHYDAAHAVWLRHQKEYDTAFRRERQAIDTENRTAVEGNEAKKIPANPNVRRATDEEIDAAARARVQIPKPGQEPLPPGARGGQPATTQPVEPTTPKAAEKEAGTTVVNQSLQELQARQDLSPEAKANAATALQAAQELVRSAGGKVTDLNPDQKRQYDEFKKIYRDLPPPRQSQDPGERSRQAYRAAYSLAPGNSDAKAAAGRMAYQKALRGE